MQYLARFHHHVPQITATFTFFLFFSNLAAVALSAVMFLYRRNAFNLVQRLQGRVIITHYHIISIWLRAFGSLYRDDVMGGVDVLGVEHKIGMC